MKRRSFVLGGFLTLVLFCGLLSGAIPARAAFSDVPENAWYTEAVNWCREYGIANDGESFFPESVMTRAMVATALYRASGSPGVSTLSKFSDASADAAISWAAETGVVTGYGDNTFRPDNPVTRQQFAAMLWRSVGSPAADAGMDYADEASISSYAKTAVDWARVTGVILGKDGNRFDPHGGATRAQAAVILYRCLKEKRDAVSDEASLLLTINGTSVEVKWEDNASVRALRELAAQKPVTIQMSPYGGFEQVGALGASLPRQDAQMTTDAGDIALYQGNQIVIFYGSNSWAYTRLGHIGNLNRQELQNLLGGNGVTAVFSLSDSDAAVSDASAVYMTKDISPEGLVKAY